MTLISPALYLFLMTDWDEFISNEMKKDYFISLSKTLSQENKKYIVYPPKEDIFNAYRCDIKSIKLVVLGQDVYHNFNQAHGLAFSVKKGVPVPPSLRNIYKELHDDIGFEIPTHGCLESWSSQGVFLINSILTVREGQPASHANIGWQEFTDNTIRLINDQDRNIVYLLWGNFARNKKHLITNKKHLILESPHPSPFSAYNGFFGSKHFSKANEFLNKNNIEPIDWIIK